MFQDVERSSLTTAPPDQSNRFVIRFLADLLKKPVATIGMPDVSALGAAYLAGLQVGIYAGIDSLKQLNQDKTIYQPNNGTMTLNKSYEGWKNAIKKGLAN